MNKNIFGKSIEFNFDDSNFSKKIMSEISIYKSEDLQSEIKINIIEKLRDETLNNNPSIYFHHKNGFTMNFGHVMIQWCFNNNFIEINVIHGDEKNKTVKDRLNKFKSMQFDYPEESAGQILHELVLVPLTYFLKDYSLIHCSAIERDGKVILLGGTGGVGKTSTLIELSKESKYRFVCDDILVINKNDAFANYAYPKIYAYNTVGDNELEKKVLRDDNLIGKFQWKYYSKCNLSRVRRRINPQKLYGIGDTQEYGIDSYIILNRGNYGEISMEKITAEKAADLTLNVIKAEYHLINNYLYWHEYNSSLMKIKPLFTLNEIFQKWENVYRSNFNNVKCYVMNVPLNIEHNKFKSEMKEIINTL